MTVKENSEKINLWEQLEKAGEMMREPVKNYIDKIIDIADKYGFEIGQTVEIAGKTLINFAKKINEAGEAKI